MKIEILYPRLCCLYGDKGNTTLLRHCLPDAEFIYTELNDRPLFLEGDIDLCCMYSMSERSQELILSRMLPFKESVAESCQSDRTLFLFTGNALELLGNFILREDGSRQEALGVFDFHSVRFAPCRFNSLIEAKFENMTLLGYTSRFSHTYGISEDIAFARTIVGCGANPDTKSEGILSSGVVATYLLGPLFAANPDFLKWLLFRLGIVSPVLPFEDAMYQSYKARRKEFQKLKTRFPNIFSKMKLE